MRYNEENIKKLASGEVALKVDRDNLELTAKVLDYAFPNDRDIDSLEFIANYGSEIAKAYNEIYWYHYKKVDCLTLPLTDFIIQEKAIQEPKTAQEITKLVDEVLRLIK